MEDDHLLPVMMGNSHLYSHPRVPIIVVRLITATLACSLARRLPW
jgi:hypothetical protein